MNKKTKILLLSGSSFYQFIFMSTSPMVQLHFIKLVDPQMFALSATITTLLAAVINTIMIKEKNRNKIKKFFKIILIIDCASYFLISFIGFDNANIRFIGLSILSSTTVNLWYLILNDLINKTLQGTNLTNFENLCKSVDLWSCLIGSLVAVIFIGKIGIEICIILQCIASFFYSIADYIAYKKMELNNL